MVLPIQDVTHQLCFHLRVCNENICEAALGQNRFLRAAKALMSHVASQSVHLEHIITMPRSPKSSDHQRIQGHGPVLSFEQFHLRSYS